MSAAEEFKARWRAYRFPNGQAGFVGVTGERDHFMLLAGGLWTSFQIGRQFFLPWIVRDSAGHGNMTGMLHVREGARNVWAEMQRLVTAEYHDAKPLGVVETAGEYAEGERAYRLHTRFTFAAGFAGFLVEPTKIENIGTVALNVPALYYRMNGGGGEKVVPLSAKNGWRYADGRKTAVTSVEGGHAEFWFQPNGHAHPDIELKIGATIAPQESWTPAAPLSAVVTFEPFTEDGQ